MLVDRYEKGLDRYGMTVERKERIPGTKKERQNNPFPHMVSRLTKDQEEMD